MLNPSDYDNISMKEAHELLLMKQKEYILSSFTFPQTPDKNGYYYVWVPDSTKKSGRRHVGAKTLTELKEKVYEFLTKAPEIKIHRSFKEVFTVANDSQLDSVFAESAALSKKNTVLRNRSEYKRYFGDTEFEERFIEEITPQDIKEFVSMNLDRYEMKKKALSSLQAIINLVYVYAMDMGWITNNPNSTVNYKKFRGMLKNETPISERAHCDEELMALLQACHEKQQKNPTYFPAYAMELQILLGLRRGEIPPLLWSDLTFNALRIHREQLTVKKDGDIPEHFAIVEHTKTYVNREYPLTDDLKDFLERLQSAHERLPSDKKSPFLFPAESKNGCITNKRSLLSKTNSV